MKLSWQAWRSLPSWSSICLPKCLGIEAWGISINGRMNERGCRAQQLL